MKRRILTTIAMVAMLAVAVKTSPASAVQPDTNGQKYPCDPGDGYAGNMIEIKVGNDPITSSKEIYVCFGRHMVEYQVGGETVIREEKNWYDDDPSTGITDAACLRLYDLPSRYWNGSSWTSWNASGGTIMSTPYRYYQFALCGSSTDDDVWVDTQRYLDPDAWDYMRILTKTSQAIRIDRVRVVQNRVRILDNLRTDQGQVDFLMDIYHNRNLDLSWRIKNTKLYRPMCLNSSSGTLSAGENPCDTNLASSDSYPYYLDYRAGMPPVVEEALKELGHSGSLKYGLHMDEGWCSEFAFYVIENGTHLHRQCTQNVPDPTAENIDVGDMSDWLDSCGRKYDAATVNKDDLRPGDYIAYNTGHSAIFLAWGDAGKTTIWDISGNNRVRTEQETDFSSSQRTNKVGIVKRSWSDVDWVGLIHN